MEFLSPFIEIIELMEAHPVVSAGVFVILGTILSAILDIRKHVVNKFEVINKEVRQNRFVAIIIGNNNQVQQSSSLSNGLKGGVSPSASPTGQQGYIGPLNKTQREICSAVKTLSERFSESLDIEQPYEEAVRAMNTNEVNLAAGKFVQVLNKISNSLKAVAENNDASIELNRLIVVSDGLYEMIHNSDPESLKRQINSCEETTWKLLVKLPL